YTKVLRHASDLEQRVAERTAELTESRERIRALYDNTPVMMHSLDENGVIIEANQFWLDNLGYQRHEMIGQPVLQFTAPDYRDYIRNVAMPQLRQEGFVRNLEAQGLRKNGETVDLLVSSVLKRDDEGRFLYSQTFLVDVTEQKRTQRENIYLQEELQSEL